MATQLELDYFDDPEERKPAFYTVALAYHDRVYGGPEEGGWYYDTYTPCTERINVVLEDTWDLPRTFHDVDAALNWAEFLDRVIAERGINEGRHNPSSVVFSRGDWLVAYVFDEFPCPLPKERPRYE